MIPHILNLIVCVCYLLLSLYVFKLRKCYSVSSLVDNSEFTDVLAVEVGKHTIEKVSKQHNLLRTLYHVAAASITVVCSYYIYILFTQITAHKVYLGFSCIIFVCTFLHSVLMYKKYQYLLMSVSIILQHEGMILEKVQNDADNGTNN